MNRRTAHRNGTAMISRTYSAIMNMDVVRKPLCCLNPMFPPLRFCKKRRKSNLVALLMICWLGLSQWPEELKKKFLKKKVQEYLEWKLISKSPTIITEP